MANLKPLIKLRKFQVEEKQKILAILLREVEKFEAKKSDLLLQIKEERRLAEESGDYETQAAYRLYVERARIQVRVFEGEINKYNHLVNKAQEDMRAAFAEMKKIEIIQENREDDEERELNRKDSAIMDEVGIDGHRRKDN